jgi:hypothetical protein
VSVPANDHIGVPLHGPFKPAIVVRVSGYDAQRLSRLHNLRNVSGLERRKAASPIVISNFARSFSSSSSSRAGEMIWVKARRSAKSRRGTGQAAKHQSRNIDIGIEDNAGDQRGDAHRRDARRRPRSQCLAPGLWREYARGHLLGFDEEVGRQRNRDGFGRTHSGHCKTLTDNVTDDAFYGSPSGIGC